MNKLKIHQTGVRSIGFILWSTVLLMFCAVAQAGTFASPEDLGKAVAISPVTKKLDLKYSHQLVIIDVDGISTPIEIEKPAITLSLEDVGAFTFTDSIIRSASRTPQYTTPAPPGTVYNFRPTLFVSIPGMNKPNDTPAPRDWQEVNLQNELLRLENDTSLRHSQYMHFVIDWDSDEPNLVQVKDVAKAIKNFLDHRAFPWDVVLIGHSRGGIFAHELTQELVGHRNIDILHTFLLDPTAAVISDHYPKYKHNKKPTRHFASLFYDDKQFPGTYGVGAQSDIPILGYDNYGRNDFFFDSNHTDFPIDWISHATQGLDGALRDIFSKKTGGAFALDDRGGMDFVKVRQKDVSAYLHSNFADGNFYVDGLLTVGPIQASIDSMVGKDGAEISVGVLLAAVQASATEDQISYGQNTVLLGDYSFQISTHGSQAQWEGLGSELDVTIGNGIEVSGNLGGSHGLDANISTSGTKIKLGGKTIIKF